ncbi:MAG: hypothetical protein CVU10_08155 [Bacteroidetes bacterium HGW-Bacteroidetes-5]|jgi:hypothetical protein|nr:MAG: hypothetical protein CVU10_08155 [Bacteroidetes bacterium HGW-Bacteroidetes-5]
MRNRQYNFLITLFTILSSVSCINGARDFDKGSNIIGVDLDTIQFQPSINNLFEKVEIIPLETRKESIIESASRLKHQVYNDKHYILSVKQNKLFVFDRKGNFVKTIDKIGNGPGEYRMIYDFEISRFDGKLHLMTPYGRMLIYDSEGDKFIESFHLPDSIRAVHQFKILNEDIYVFNSDSENSDLYFYSKSKNTIVLSLSVMPNFLTSTPFKYARTPFYYYKDSLRYFMGYDGTVFNINPQNYSLEKRYFLDFGKRNFMLENLPLNESVIYYFEHYKSISNKIATGFAIYFETDKYLISRYSYNNNHNYLFYNKSNKTLMTAFKLKEGIQLSLNFLEKDTLYSFIPVEFAHLYVNDKVVSQENFNRLQMLSSDSNMFIIKYVLK